VCRVGLALSVVPSQWFPDNPIEFGADVATRVATQLKKDYPKGVQGVGFCIGARLVVDLITKHSLLKAGVLHHPTFLNEQDIPLVNVPMLFNLASREEIFAPELRAKFEERLTKEVPGSKFIDYPGTEHGFGARPEGEEAHKSSAEAAVNSVAFFKQNK
jgi:dienelactone hydrolase